MFWKNLTSLCSALLAVSLVAPSLLAQGDEFGKWIPLFNGEDLTGWQTAKPRQKQGQNLWMAEEGTLTNRSGGVNDICTTEEFQDYELDVEYRINEGSNSGVYLRGQIEIQIRDTFGKEKLGSHDNGAIYGGNHPALVNVQKAPGEWNRFRILHIGHRITVWHNGALIQDNVYQDRPTGGAMRNYPGRDDKLTMRRGPLMFQGNHGKVWLRNIRIRPLFTDPGWKSLWNGKDLSGFHRNRGLFAGGKVAESKKDLRWEVRDHAFTNTATGHGGGHDIWTDGSFGNFLVYYAYRSDIREKDDEGREIRDRSGNSGFYLRDQWEIQILGHQKLGNRGTDGALYSIHPPRTLARHGDDQWNHMFVKLVQDKITIWQNGKLIHENQDCKGRRTDSNRETPVFSRAPFKLQGDHGKVWFASLMVLPLPDDAVE